MTAPAPSPTATKGSSPIRRFSNAELSTPAILAAKDGHVLSVIIPARDEAVTIGGVIDALRPHRHGFGTGLLDEILVIDDGSSDNTATIAERAGATVLSLTGGGGKGAAMLAGVEASAGDLIVFLDADVANTSAGWIPRLLGPLVLDPEIMLVKAFYERPIGGEATGGGRVTELCARPMLELLFPELAGVSQPLAGETALRREVVERLGLETGYRVEMGLLIDVGTTFGPRSIAEVDLGVRIHRNRPLSELGPMAAEVMAVALERSGRISGCR